MGILSLTNMVLTHSEINGIFFRLDLNMRARSLVDNDNDVRFDHRLLNCYIWVLQMIAARHLTTTAPRGLNTTSLFVTL